MRVRAECGVYVEEYENMGVLGRSGIQANVGVGGNWVGRRDRKE